MDLEAKDLDLDLDSVVKDSDLDLDLDLDITCLQTTAVHLEMLSLIHISEPRD